MLRVLQGLKIGDLGRNFCSLMMFFDSRLASEGYAPVFVANIPSDKDTHYVHCHMQDLDVFKERNRGQFLFRGFL